MVQKRKKKKNHQNGLTHERILDEAEILFARKGYHAVSIREITNSAGCNLAAVNYHFGNKQNLYLEVFRSRWIPRASRINKCFRQSLAANNTLSPAAVVQSFAGAFISGPMTDDERKRHHQLIYGELAKPTEAFEIVADEMLRPLFKILQNDLRAAMTNEIEEEQLTLNAFSILAMVLYFNFARHLITRFTGAEYNADFKSRLVEHIVKFSLYGIGGDDREILK